MATFKNGLIYQGAHYDGSFKCKFFIFYRTYGLVIAFIQYFITICEAFQQKTILRKDIIAYLPYKLPHQFAIHIQFILAFINSKTLIALLTGDFMQIVDCLHWIADYIIVISMNLSCLYHTRLFNEMDATINAGYYDYGGELTEEQIKVRIDKNRSIQSLSNTYLPLSYCALTVTFLRVIFVAEEYPLPYPLWIPYKITNSYAYIGTMLHVWIIAETLAFAAFVHWSTFLALSSHIVAQYKILILALKEIDIIAENEGNPKEKEIVMLRKLKGCAVHHIIIIKYFEDLQKFFNVPLLTTAFGITLTICSVGFVVLAPNASMPDVGGLLILLLPESLVVGVYCVCGQNIADVSEELCESIYHSEWYSKPLSVQKDLLTLMIGSKKIRQLTGMGLHEFSMKGLSEIIKATFSYFNMLRAMQQM